MTPGAGGDPSELGLIVPVDIVAFCVGVVDEHRATPLFAGAMTNFVSQTTQERAAFLGVNVTRSLQSDPPLQPLGKGVHLHWALPDALTRSTVVDGRLDFPAAPNRWLVTRYHLQGQAVTARTWVVESDALATQQGGQTPVTLPVRTASPAEQDYRYLGRWYDYSQAWRSTPSNIKDLTGQPLTAVTSGVVSFAAYYPNSCSVFGFWDQLDDVDTKGGSADLMYAIAGWYDDPTDDPLHDGLDVTALREAYGWTFDDGDSRPSYSLYSGLVQSIEWNPDRDYLYLQPNLAPIPAAAAAGNNPAEALTAYFKNLDHPQEPLFEDLFDAFQLGLLNAFQDPRPDGLVQLLASLRSDDFATTDAGTMYAVVRADDLGEPDVLSDIVELPLRLAGDLNLLNLYQQQSDLCRRHMNVYRYQLFADWYRIFMASPENQNAAFTAAYYKLFWWDALAAACESYTTRAADQKAVVESQLADRLLLQAIAAPRYYQPAEPVVLLEGGQLAYPPRYGNTGADAGGYLPCRLTTQTVTAATVEGTVIGSDRFSALVLPEPNGLPHSGVFSQLRVEAALLNTDLAAAITSLPAATLQDGLDRLLTHRPQAVYQLVGQGPAPIAVDWWAGNPWMPLFLLWTVELLPVHATESGREIRDYADTFFTANFEVSPDQGGSIAYRPKGPGVDPSQATFPQSYAGASLLQPGPAASLAVQIDQYLTDHTDPTLAQIRAQLAVSNILVQPLSGFNDLLAMAEQAIQLNVKVPPRSTYEEITREIAAVVGDMNVLGPQFNSSFNPIRAGFVRLSFEVAGVFGERRTIEYKNLTPIDSMIAKDPKTGIPVANVAYLEPRISQPARLLFRWLSADSTEFEEMNAHPATTPICGWLLPNHLDGSFFVFSEQGKALGTLYLNGNESEVLWQSAPGDNSTINQSVEQVLEFANPRLRDLAIALKSSPPEFFTAFWRAVDTAQDTISPANLSANSSLSVLVGRPVALVQAALRLEVDGSPAINLGWQSFIGDHPESDADFTGVGMPVILGAVDQLSDGLLGYFKEKSTRTGYDLGTFYSDGAAATSSGGVVRPTKDNLVLTSTPKPDRIVMSPSVPPSFAADDLASLNEHAQKVLMLMDPRAPVNATPGFLPTKALTIPNDLSDAALSALETSILVAPALRSGSGLALPIPPEQGYAFSWVAQIDVDGAPRWEVDPRILVGTGAAIWAYTPQTMVEGWLRMNPVLLEFDLLNADGQPAVVAGLPNALTLEVRNRKPASITLTPGTLVAEGEPNPGSTLYFHVEALVAQPNIPAIQPSAGGWRFQAFQGSRLGWYWAATPVQAVTMAPGASLRMTLANVIPAQGPTRAQVFFDYYNVTGVNDGIDADLVAIQTPPQIRRQR